MIEMVTFVGFSKLKEFAVTNLCNILYLAKTSDIFRNFINNHT